MTYPHKIAVLGSGGREHAIAWKLGKDIGPENVFVLPGNAAIPNSHEVNINSFDAVRDFCIKNNITRIFVGPEQPLAAGIVDFFKQTGIRVLGPDAAAARLESSKIFAKEFMQRYGVQTAPFRTFDHIADARRYVRAHGGPLVIKFDGLAGGKGVFVCGHTQNALAALDELSRKYGDAARLVIEEKLDGDEISVIGFTDGRDIFLLPPSQDHKQLLDGDRGPNTGGMGAFCPVPGWHDDLQREIESKIIRPTLRGIAAEGMHYKGVVYFGIIITARGPYLLEYNVRLGDPETEVLMPALRNNLAELMEACLNEEIGRHVPAFADGYFVDVVLASGGYPGDYETGFPIEVRPTGDVRLFYAGVSAQGDRMVTAGGRVLHVVAQGADLDEAIARAYAGVETVRFRTKYFRRDIGRRLNAILSGKTVAP